MGISKYRVSQKSKGAIEAFIYEIDSPFMKAGSSNNTSVSPSITLHCLIELQLFNNSVPGGCGCGREGSE